MKYAGWDTWGAGVNAKAKAMPVASGHRAYGLAEGLGSLPEKSTWKTHTSVCGECLNPKGEMLAERFSLYESVDSLKTLFYIKEMNAFKM